MSTKSDIKLSRYDKPQFMTIIGVNRNLIHLIGIKQYNRRFDVELTSSEARQLAAILIAEADRFEKPNTECVAFETEHGTRISLQVAKSLNTGDPYLRVFINGQLSLWRWNRAVHEVYGACLARPDFTEIIPIPQKMIEDVDNLLSQPTDANEYAQP